jgi:hypothetical protein
LLLHLRISGGLLPQAIQLGDALLDRLLPIDLRRRLRRGGAAAAAGVVADIDVVPDGPIAISTAGVQLTDGPIDRPARAIRTAARLLAVGAATRLTVRRSLSAVRATAGLLASALCAALLALTLLTTLALLILAAGAAVAA